VLAAVSARSLLEDSARFTRIPRNHHPARTRIRTSQDRIHLNDGPGSRRKGSQLPGRPRTVSLRETEGPQVRMPRKNRSSGRQAGAWPRGLLPRKVVLARVTTGRLIGDFGVAGKVRRAEAMRLHGPTWYEELSGDEVPSANRCGVVGGGWLSLVQRIGRYG
jgi:hypothetical protein